MPTRVFSEEERERIRQQMLEAGFPLLKEYGMTHTSISKITEAAGIAVGTFYKFWKNKEAYMAELISYHAHKMMPGLIGAEAIAGKRKLGREDAARYLRAVVDENISIYPHMTLEDEAGLLRATNAFVPDLAKESAVAESLLQYLDHVRADVNLGLVANLTKVLVLTAESREELHESAYRETLEVQIETILNLIFEEE
jgi:AcrR family transcriptional regulator